MAVLFWSFDIELGILYSSFGNFSCSRNFIETFKFVHADNNSL